MSESVFITGADGYIGSLVARQYLESSPLTVIAGVRADNEDELSLKEQRVRDIIGDVEVVPCNLTESNPLDHLLKNHQHDVVHLVHSAARTKFNVEYDVAFDVNVKGSQKVAEHARELTNLTSYGHLSSVYASGLRSGDIFEELGENVGFANHYEWSKWETENTLCASPKLPPLKIMRISTAICDDEKGRVVQQNAFHQTLKLCYYGLISIVPGQKDIPLHFVTGNFAANSIFQIMNSNENGHFNIAHENNASVTIEKLLDIAFNVFNTDEKFTKRRILPPLIADQETFEKLNQGLSGVGAGVVAQALESMASFAKQLYITKTLHNERMRSIVSNYASPDTQRIVQNTCEYLVSSSWGKNES